MYVNKWNNDKNVKIKLFGALRLKLVMVIVVIGIVKRESSLTSADEQLRINQNQFWEPWTMGSSWMYVISQYNYFEPNISVA